MNLKKFFSELERRKVYRVSIAYGITAWVLAQITSLVSNSFEAEPWVMKMIISILILGFPAALALTWIFDNGPEGIERTASVDDSTSEENQPISVKMEIAYTNGDYEKWMRLGGEKAMWNWGEKAVWNKECEHQEIGL